MNLSRQSWLLIRRTLGPVALLLLASCSAPASDYTFVVIAQTGKDNITAIGNSPSINDMGQVAFMATKGGLDGVYVGDGSSTPCYASSGKSGSAIRFGPAVQINNDGWVAATDRVTTSPILSFVRRYHCDYSYVTIAKAGASSTCYYYDTILSYPSICNTGDGGEYPVAFSAMRTTGGSTFTYLAEFPAACTKVERAIVSGTTPGLLRPTVADNGTVVLRHGNTPNSSILSFGPDLSDSTMTVVASKSVYSALGRSPGISDNGEIVAFYGVQDGRPGIFVSVKSGAVWAAMRVAGISRDGFLDPGEQWVDQNGDGVFNGWEDFGQFSAFSADTRVGVNNRAQVVFQADDSNGVHGLYRMDLTVDRSASPPTVQVLDTSGFAARVGEDLNGLLPSPIQSIQTYDPINNKGSLAFYAEIGAGIGCVVRSRSPITFHRVEAAALEKTSEDDDVDAPLVVSGSKIADLPVHPEWIPEVQGGLVADGVTPLMIRFRPNDLEQDGSPSVYTVATTITGGSIGSPGLVIRAYDYITGGFGSGQSITLSKLTPTGILYIEGIKGEALPVSNALELTVTVSFTRYSTGLSESAEFRIRRPPIVLVHGYNALEDTWTTEFTDVLHTSVPSDFVIPIRYPDLADAKRAKAENTSGRLDHLVFDLDVILRKKFEDDVAPLKAKWAYTRYDAVCHSQGGVLVRMLCTVVRKYSSRQFRDPGNSYRGRFRRIITIGSPHNGTTLPYYLKLSELAYLIPPYSLKSLVPFIMDGMGLLQPKFIPFQWPPFGNGECQISDVNANKIDENAKFCLIRATISDGYPSATSSCNALSYELGNLCGIRGPLVIPHGSDGVVDYDSQGAGGGTHVVDIPVDTSISHANVPLLFGTQNSETSSSIVANKVVDLLDGSVYRFGKFYNPFALSDVDELRIKGAVATIVVGKLVRLLISPAAQSTASQAGFSSYTYFLHPLDAEPEAAPPIWTAAVFGSNGVSADGVSTIVDPSDPNKVTVNVDDGVEGTVVLYASYTSTSGKWIIAEPTVVVDRPVGTTLTAIELSPATMDLSVDDQVDYEAWGIYDGVKRSRLYIPSDGSAEWVSSNTQVVDASRLTSAKAVGAGTATLSLTYAGLTGQAVVSVTPKPVPIPRAKMLADGIETLLLGPSVTAVFDDRLYVEETDRTAGLCVSNPLGISVSVGDRVTVQARMGTSADGERSAEAVSLELLGQDSEPIAPLFMRSSDVGGQDYYYDSLSGAGQRGVVGGRGINNIGLLARASGKVTQIGSDYLYLDDGSSIKDGTLTGVQENIGVRVVCNPAGRDIGDYLGVTGISSCFETPSGELARRVLTRSDDDITVYRLVNGVFTSVGALKKSGTGRNVTLATGVVTATSEQMGGFLYVEDAIRTAGIRVNSADARLEGDVVSAAGVFAVDPTGEVVIDTATTGLLSHRDPLAPFGMTNAAIGGWNLGAQQGISGALGLGNIGLLVRVWGRIIDRDPVTPPLLPTWFTLDDGSGVNVKCAVPSGLIIDPAWDYVGVTGISSCEKIEGQLHRLLRVRTPSDITPY